MSTVRRLYFYGLVLLSVEVIIWGTINLLRTIVSQGLAGDGQSLATGLSLVLVGIPIFWLHWRTVQRDALREPEEHASRIRAVFLYSALFATLVPMVYAVLALVDRWLTTLFGQPATSAWFGADGSALDNIIAIIINALALAYFWYILRKDWLADIPENFLAETRRLYRYLWVLFGLIITIVGIYNLIRYLFGMNEPGSDRMPVTLASGISLALVGAPMWAYHWMTVQNTQVDPQERRSLLRLVVLYLVSLAGVVGVLSTVSTILSSLLAWILGDATSLGQFRRDNAGALSLAIPLAVMWWYYGHILGKEVSSLPDQPRREALGRLYNYILSLLGLAVTFAGLINLVDYLAQVVVGHAPIFGNVRGESMFRSLLSGALAALAVGLPLWLVSWRKMQREAMQIDDTGDHARRSVLRKAYLYLALFLLVTGAMGFAGWLLYTLISALLNGVSGDFARDVIRLFLSLIIDVALLLYHWRSLRQDNRLAQQAMGDLHAAFPTLVFVEEDGAFGKLLVDDLQRIAPRLPIALHMVERGAPDDTMLGARAVLLPVGLALNPPESLKLWLNEYQGRRILIPLPAENWGWLGQADKQETILAREAAQAIRQMAEGESVRQAAPSNPWVIASYIMGGIFGLLVLWFLFVLIVSSLFQ